MEGYFGGGPINDDDDCKHDQLSVRQSVGVYTAEPMQRDGIFMQGLPEDASPKLRTIVRNVERSICQRLNINVEDLGKVALSDKARDQTVAWAAYKAFDLDVTPVFLELAALPMQLKTAGVTMIAGILPTIAVFNAGAPLWAAGCVAATIVFGKNARARLLIKQALIWQLSSVPSR